MLRGAGWLSENRVVYLWRAAAVAPAVLGLNVATRVQAVVGRRTIAN